MASPWLTWNCPNDVVVNPMAAKSVPQWEASRRVTGPKDHLRRIRDAGATYTRDGLENSARVEKL